MSPVLTHLSEENQRGKTLMTYKRQWWAWKNICSRPMSGKSTDYSGRFFFGPLGRSFFFWRNPCPGIFTPMVWREKPTWGNASKRCHCAAIETAGSKPKVENSYATFFPVPLGGSVLNHTAIICVLKIFRFLVPGTCVFAVDVPRRWGHKSSTIPTGPTSCLGNDWISVFWDFGDKFRGMLTPKFSKRLLLRERSRSDWQGDISWVSKLKTSDCSTAGRICQIGVKKSLLCEVPHLPGTGVQLAAEARKWLEALDSTC